MHLLTQSISLSHTHTVTLTYLTLRLKKVGILYQLSYSSRQDLNLLTQSFEPGLEHGNITCGSLGQWSAPGSGTDADNVVQLP